MKSEFDLATDILKQRITMASSEIQRRSKGSDPYRQKPVSAKERLLTFSQFTPEMIQQARMAMGDDAVDNYLSEMQRLIGRQRNGNA